MIIINFVIAFQAIDSERFILLGELVVVASDAICTYNFGKLKFPSLEV